MKNSTPDEWERKAIPSEVLKQLMIEKRDRSVQKPPGIVSTMLERPLTLASLNIRGLRGDTPKPKEIKA
jgi:hypothetical protein